MTTGNVEALICTIALFSAVMPQTLLAANPARVKKHDAPKPADPAKRDTPVDSTFEKLGAFGEFDIVTLTDSDSSLALQGMGLGGGAHYRMKAGQSAVLFLGGGIQYTTVSASSSGVSISYTLMTLRPDFAVFYQPTRKWGVGGFLADDIMLLSGSASVKFDDTTTSTSVSSVSQMLFGLRGVYEITPRLYLGGQYGTGSGSVKVKDSSGSFKSSIMGLFIEKTF